MKWKDIPNYEGLYQASDTGEIRSVRRHRIMAGRGDYYNPGRRVTLYKDGKHSDRLVSRLVATTFLGPPNEGDTVNHKDGNRLNNEVSNLEWMSRGDNLRHAHATGLMHRDCDETILRGKDGEHKFRSMAEASRFLGRHRTYISHRVCCGRMAVSRDGSVYAVEVKKKHG